MSVVKNVLLLGTLPKTALWHCIACHVIASTKHQMGCDVLREDTLKNSSFSTYIVLNFIISVVLDCGLDVILRKATFEKLPKC